MQYFLFKIGQRTYSHARSKSLREWVKNQLILDKLETPVGYMLLGGLAMALAFWVAVSSPLQAWLILLNIILIPALLGAMLHQRFGIKVLVVGAFLIGGFERFVPDVPLDTYLDLSIIVMLFGILVKQSKERDWRFLRNGVSAMLAIWLGYHILELWNPIAPGVMPWLQASRKTGLILLLFFVALFCWHKLQHLRNVLFLWVGLTSLFSIYGIVQVWGEVPTYEMDWLLSNRGRFQEFFNLDGLRAFSTFHDPSSFGILLAGTILLSIGLLFDPQLRSWQKSLLGLGTLIMLIAMVLSSTRTALVILPAGFIFYALLSMEKRIIIGAAAVILIIVGLQFIPFQSTYLRHFQASFHPQESISYQTQMENLAYLQPHIRKHAMGAGMGSTGAIGQKYAPYSLFSEFPARSGFIRIAVEMGWVGLLLYLLLLGTVIWVGVRKYFRIQDPSLKLYSRTTLSLFLVLVLAHYPHQVLSLWPTNVLFVLTMAAVIKIPLWAKKKDE